MYHTTVCPSGQSQKNDSPTESQVNNDSEGLKGCNGCSNSGIAFNHCKRNEGCAYPPTRSGSEQKGEGGASERSEPANCPGEAANRLSTFHISPFFQTTGEAGATERSEGDQRPGEGGQKREWRKAVLPCWDSYIDPTSEKEFYYRTEQAVNVPIEPQAGQVEVVEPKMLIAIDGGLAKVVKGREKFTQPETDRKKPGHRGVVETFSAGARRRMMRLLSKTNQANRPIFCTLTYSDYYPGNAETVKRHLDNFGKRILRKYPGASFLWRVETKKRLSGDNSGQIAPHFHLLLWGVDYSELALWLPVAWNSVVFRNVDKWGGDIPDVEREKAKHLAVHQHKDAKGVQDSVQELRSWRGVMFYAGKYIAKKDDSPTSDADWQWSGKHWGVVGRDNIPLSVVLVVDIMQGEAIKAIRTARKMIGLVGRDLLYGITWFIGGGEAERYLRWLHEGKDFPHNAKLTGMEAKALW